MKLTLRTVPPAPRPRKVKDLPRGTLFTIRGLWPLYCKSGRGNIIVGNGTESRDSTEDEQSGDTGVPDLNDLRVEAEFGILWLTVDP